MSLDWLPWLLSLGFAFLGWAIGRSTNRWFAASREATRRMVLVKGLNSALIAVAYWLIVWQVLKRFDLFDLTAGVVVGLMMVPFAALGYMWAVRQHAQSLFGRRLPRRLRPRMFIRRS